MNASADWFDGKGLIPQPSAELCLYFSLGLLSQIIFLISAQVTEYETVACGVKFGETMPII
jgi:hypothetical protein